MKKILSVLSLIIISYLLYLTFLNKVKKIDSDIKFVTEEVSAFTSLLPPLSQEYSKDLIKARYMKWSDLYIKLNERLNSAKSSKQRREVLRWLSQIDVVYKEGGDLQKVESLKITNSPE